MVSCRFDESAIVYAQTRASFEEITLKFLQLREKHALKVFLFQKLNSLRQQVRTRRDTRLGILKAQSTQRLNLNGI